MWSEIGYKAIESKTTWFEIRTQFLFTVMYECNAAGRNLTNIIVEDLVNQKKKKEKKKKEKKKKRRAQTCALRLKNKY